jgi:3,5-epimerase/4-reductase
MKVITLGGGFIADHLPYEKITDRITPNEDHIEYVLSDSRPDVIVNCVGKTGRPNVDWCETHQTETYQANVVLPLMIADWCEQNDVHMIHIGSGCIYFGESPNFHYVQGDGSLMPDPIKTYSLGDPNYELWMAKAFTMVMPAKKIDEGWKETDFANPQSYYSKTKYACDLALGQMPHVTTLRIRMPVSDRDVHRNLINKLRAYSQVIDIPNSMTFMSDLVRCIEWFTWQRLVGIYHVANPGTLTAAQIMREYQKYVPTHTFEIITELQLDRLTTTKRSNCVLNINKLTRAGFIMTPAEQALQQCMQNYIRRQHVE